MQDSYNARPHRSQSDDLDAVLPQMPTLLQSPTVHGALTGLLGAGYFRHGHSGITIDGPAPDPLPGAALDASASHQHGMARLRDGQGWHRVTECPHLLHQLLLPGPSASTFAADGRYVRCVQDSYAGVQRAHSHRPRWLFCMYCERALTSLTPRLSHSAGCPRRRSKHCAAGHGADGRGARVSLPLSARRRRRLRRRARPCDPPPPRRFSRVCRGHRQRANAGAGGSAAGARRPPAERAADGSGWDVRLDQLRALPQAGGPRSAADPATVSPPLTALHGTESALLMRATGYC